MLGYGRYIRLKLEEDDGELTQVMTGYPAWKDEIYSESLEEQKEKWFAGEKKTLEAEEHRKAEQTRKMRKTLEMALELDRPELYDAYLSKGIRNFIKEYWRQNGLENCAAAKRLPERLYFGNQFCHLDVYKRQFLIRLTKVQRAVRDQRWKKRGRSAKTGIHG